MDAHTYLIRAGGDPAAAGDRDTVGGWPVLDAGQPWPVCPCGARMALYFQLLVPADVAHFAGDQLLAFQCPVESDACFQATGQLPPEFWDHPPANDHAHWRILLQRNATEVAELDPHLRPHRLTLERAVDDDDTPGYEGPLQDFKVGGSPHWFQGAEHLRCPCGAELVFLGQVAENYDFGGFRNDTAQAAEAIALDDGFLLGNMVYLLACPAHCHPAAVYPVCQN
ncbi:hypothetical protein [Nocardia asteroides]|uniref:hypothetical protein n=1 Tax=Nocardia asteroides TaxID=1824 RepID=UPI001E3C55A3|nr:hypothetical protein [Nocardia asteroides]UGT60735.1 hypothetical protein LTT61_26845 [Nocardia asteroides]